MTALYRNGLLKILPSFKWTMLNTVISKSVELTGEKLYIFSEERLNLEIITKIYQHHGALDLVVLGCGLPLHEYTEVDDIDIFMSPYEHDFKELEELQTTLLHWKKTKFMHIPVESTHNDFECTQSYYSYGVLGGTFDYLHTGHKLLLTVASAICTDKLLVGLTHEDLLKKKKLVELLQPYDQRENCVRRFLKIVNPTLDVELVPISDPIGPAGTDPDLNVLIVSKETEVGISIVNEGRKSNGLNILDACIVDLVFPSDNSKKLSSSTSRNDVLGEFIEREDKPWLRRRKGNHGLETGQLPYVIGLTGGICSGKSTISSYLKNKGILTIDCDKIGHLTYQPDGLAFSTIVEEFGTGILESGQIDRRLLGPIVFSDPSKMKKLNGIVWPCIAQLVMRRIEEAEADLIVVEAAVMLEAGWQSFVDEVWVMTVSPLEAIHRLSVRNKLSAEDAKKRLGAQMNNTERCRQADVVICSDWEVDVTRSFMDKAWCGLQRRLDYYRICQHSSSLHERWAYLVPFICQDSQDSWLGSINQSEEFKSFLDVSLNAVDETLHLSQDKWHILYTVFFFLATTLDLKNPDLEVYETMLRKFKDRTALKQNVADEIMQNITIANIISNKSVPCTEFNLLFQDIWMKSIILYSDDQQIVKPARFVQLLGENKFIFRTKFFRKSYEDVAKIKLKKYNLENIS